MAWPCTKRPYTLTSYCAFVHKTSEHDEHLYVADDVEPDFLVELSDRTCLCRAKAATLKRKVEKN